MNKIGMGIAAATVAFGLTNPVNATTFSFEWVSNDSQIVLDVTETLANTQNAVGGYDIQSVVGGIAYTGGTVGGITGLIENVNQPFISQGGVGPWDFNNVTYMNKDKYFDNAGLLFAAGGFQYNLYTITTGTTNTYYLSSDNTAAGYFPGTPGNISVVPEMSTMMLMITGFLTLAFGASVHRKTSRYTI